MIRYDSYKNSGVEWIGEIPNHWDLSKIKFLLKKRNEKNNPVITDNILSLSIKKGVTLQSEKPTGGNKPKDDLSKYNIVQKNDIVINSMNVIVGSVGLSKYFGLVSPVYYILYSNNENLEIRYYDFLFSGKQFQKSLIGEGNGIMILESSNGKLNTIRMRIPYEKLGNKEFPVPPLSEQQQIVSFLDTKTSLIDSLIKKTQRKIELLKEKRTSLINEVVTKGLNPNVEMKDSGVEWIGEIPSHWEITKMKFGVNHLSEKGKPDKTDIKISPENVESDTGVCFNLYSEHESDGMRFQSGDILLNKLRLYLKKILFTEYDGFSLGEMIVLRTNNKLNNKYFYQLLFSQGLIDLLDSQSTGIKLPRVSPDVILNTEIVYPPLNEQQQIVEYLDEQTQLIDKTISIEEKRIELLKEYRQSLISEVATGKRKVG
tara:strand:+ start:1871 stop:3157 length:1287 start_codon:yes stop_codon:yes gene_type:complete